jgi:TRAP-type C4-dicarboxylate transport system permease small subunit
MGKLREHIGRINRGVGRAETYFLGTSVAVMTLTTLLQVAFRYVLNDPLVWSEELARYLFVWITLVGAGAAVRTGGHFGLDLFYRKFPAAGRTGVAMLISAVIAVFAAVLLVYGVRETIQASVQLAPSLQIRMHWAYAAMPVGAALMLWHLIAHWVTKGFGVHPCAHASESP